jgi:hypothetical protein
MDEKKPIPVTVRITRLRRSVAWCCDYVRGRSFALSELDKKLASIITKRNEFFIKVAANVGNHRVSQSG